MQLREHRIVNIAAYQTTDYQARSNCDSDQELQTPAGFKATFHKPFIKYSVVQKHAV